MILNSDECSSWAVSYLDPRTSSVRLSSTSIWMVAVRSLATSLHRSCARWVRSYLTPRFVSSFLSPPLQASACDEIRQYKWVWGWHENERESMVSTPWAFPLHLLFNPPFPPFLVFNAFTPNFPPSFPLQDFSHLLASLRLSLDQRHHWCSGSRRRRPNQLPRVCEADEFDVLDPVPSSHTSSHHKVIVIIRVRWYSSVVCMAL